MEDSPKGFPIVASYLDSDDCFMIYRRFGFLHARLLLNKQDELRELEEELRDADERDKKGDARAQKCLQSRSKDNSRGLPEGWERSRQELLVIIEKKVMEYGRNEQSCQISRDTYFGKDALLLQAQQLVSLNRPADRDHTSVINFLQNRNPLFESEQSFIYEKEDLITLRPGRETAFLDAFVERMLKWSNCKPIQVSFWYPYLGIPHAANLSTANLLF